MQNVMTTLHSWCNERDLILNTTKTKEILFTNEKDNPNPPEVTINDTPLERVEAYKYLATTITNKLKFHRNTELLIKNARTKTIHHAEAKISGHFRPASLNMLSKIHRERDVTPSNHYLLTYLRKRER